MDYRTEIDRRIGKHSRRVGHVFSGGRGLSYHICIEIKLNNRIRKIRTYGNGVLPYELVHELTSIPGFYGVEFVAD